ncbi:MAG: response regulator [Bacteroidota bacterium]|nr:response regulator [Bacteroidota bacterium]
MRTILLIDDDDIFLMLTKKIIENTSFVNQIHTCKNGKEAIELLSENLLNHKTLPEYIFLDINMPVLDGWGFLEEFNQLKTQYPIQVHIYLISSTISPYDLTRAKENRDVSDIFIKPISKDLFSQIFNKG